ncbi:MAG: hypothetical protein JRH11_27760, partial [Deltaproteobacteria bacterium]|nr:hypothetical protein [Deltaproteobacteria bacterium]
MATKTWRLVVTELGGSAPLSDVSVEATNWMAAMKAGRAAAGEDGGVPPGASCAVAPGGQVTIHDPVARKTYTLTPGARVEAPKTPEAVAAQPAAAAPAPVPKKRVSTNTISYNVNDHGPIVKPQEITVGQADAQPAAAPAAATPEPAAPAPAAP